MPEELRPGVMTALFAKLSAEGEIRGRFALGPLVLGIEAQAKRNASSGSHLYGTKTPAFPDSGPAVISGTLRRTITHTPIKMVGDAWETRVGCGAGFYPLYGGKSRTPSSKYGYYLETGLRNETTYPFLMPAFKFMMGYPSKLIYDSIYGKSWAVL